jgi:hypothetical protein
MKYTYQKVQYGYWGKTALKNARGDLIQKSVKADNPSDADRLVSQLDPDKKLSNGDYRGWIRLDTI